MITKIIANIQILIHISSSGVCEMSSLAEHLTKQKLVSPSELERCAQISVETNTRLPWVLSQLGTIDDEKLVQAASLVSGLEIASNGFLNDSECFLDNLNQPFLKTKKLLVVSGKEGQLTLLTTDADDVESFEALAFAVGEKMPVKLVSISDMEELLQRHLNYDEQRLADYGLGDDTNLNEDIERLLDGVSEAPIIRLVQETLVNAVKAKASDVHIEPMSRHLSVRYRVDGHLSEVQSRPLSLSDAVASRIKVMAGLDISESRLPQDGRIKITVHGQAVDIRVSTSPIANGESIVMRLLGRSELPLDLDELGIPEHALSKIYRALDRPHGIILLTGPTGSGKTTTLYAAINRLRTPEVKILTVEDPVEVMLDGINQVQVHDEIGLSYASALKSFLRQDPDILMIGEIRDAETAEIAHRSALTGHLVLSTLHTNSAIGAFTRLDDIGVEPFLAASTVNAVIAQRLVRCLCDRCKRPVPTDAETIFSFEKLEMLAPSSVFEAVGCASCKNSGYVGRRPIVEVIEMDDALRGLVRKRAPEQYEMPLQTSLMGHGLELVARGFTSIDEVNRAANLL